MCTGKAIRSGYSHRSQFEILSGPHNLEGLRYDINNFQWSVLLSIKQVILRCSPVKMFKTLRCKQSPVIHGSLDC